MRAISDRLEISTDDGSYGHHCFNCDVLKLLIESGEEFDMCVAIGPVPMMKAVCNVSRPFGLKTVVSLNPIMIDATGMCGVCRVTIGGTRRFACVDGPEFEGDEIDFDELMMRLRTYHEQERQAMDEYMEAKRVAVQQ
jgi:ferredoxin--NADP+ reductase